MSCGTGWPVLTLLTLVYYVVNVETIIFKAPTGTKARLRRINRNLSQLLREQVETLIGRAGKGSAYDKAASLCGSVSAPRTASTSRDYLKQYGKKRAA